MVQGDVTTRAHIKDAGLKAVEDHVEVGGCPKQEELNDQDDPEAHHHFIG